MMSPRNKQRAWRIGSIVFFIGLPLLLVSLIFSSLSAISDIGDRALREKGSLAQIVARLARHSSKDMSDEDKASLYLTSASGSLARAEIQERTTALVDRAGGRILETQPTGTAEEEADGNVAIQVTLDIDNKGLFDLLYSIESGLPLMTLSSLNVRKMDASGEGKTNDDAQLHIEMTVQGHFRKSTG